LGVLEGEDPVQAQEKDWHWGYQIVAKCWQANPVECVRAGRRGLLRPSARLEAATRILGRTAICPINSSNLIEW
jgi:hypothetical protein